MTKRKKAQEEIAGFFIIVLIVVIVLVIFLGISLQKSNKTLPKESIDRKQFLESVMQYTTDCAISYEPAYLILSELIQECNEGLSICISGKQPCTIAKETINALIDKSFLISEKAATKGYEFKAIHDNNKTNKEIITLAKGNCSNSIRGAETLIPAFPGTIINTLKLCY